MATILLAKPVARPPAGTSGNGPIASLPAASHCNDADFVTLNGSNQIAEAGANATSIAGIIQHDSSAVFTQTDTDIQGVFGATQINTALVPNTPGECLVATLGPPIVVEMNLTTLSGWVSGGTYQAVIGTQIGLAVDSATGYYLADPNASNKVGYISGKPVGPNKGVVGDLAARVLVTFNISALDPVQGM